MNTRLVLGLLLALASPGPELRYFRYTRPVQVPASGQPQACAALDSGLFAHAATGLADLRLYRNGAEEPYLVHRVAPAQPEARILALLDIGARGGQTVFDVEMPAGRYDSVDLSLAGQDFVATVNVRGSQTQPGPQTQIGSYTVFDLTTQKLGRGTTLALPISDYRFLHFAVSAPIRRQSILGVRVTQVNEQVPRYIDVAHAGPGVTRGRITELSIVVPARTPVDRVVFVPASEPPLFERTVRITATPARPTPDLAAGERPVTEGSLLRIHGVQRGQRIDQERLSLDVEHEDTEETVWAIAIENGDDRPLAIQSIRLEMAERDLCFNAQPAATLALNYGDPALAEPRYDYATLAGVQPRPVAAVLGPEALNPSWQARPDARPFTERNPWLLWLALVFVVGLLAWLTLRTAKRRIITD